jgi:signal peptidase I
MSALGLGLALAGAALVWLRHTFIVITVSGDSMEPSLYAGDRLLVRRMRASSMRPGQIAVLRWPGPPPVAGQPWMVKRVAAAPGDPIPAGSLPTAFAELTRVPARRLVMLGDNSALSYDSRSLGLLGTELLRGVVVRRLGAKDSGHSTGRAVANAAAETWTSGPRRTRGILDVQAPRTGG